MSTDTKLAALLEKKALIDGGNAAVNQHGNIVDARTNPKAVPVPHGLPKAPPVVLAIMQNQWLKNPERHERNLADVLKRHGKKAEVNLWRRMIHFALFRGCRSGQVLWKHLGELCDAIVWDEASRVIGSHPSDCPPADLEHVRWTIADVRPSIIITFGKVASNAVDAILDKGFESKRQYREINLYPTFIQSPHPAARGEGMQESVREACVALRNAVQRHS